MTMMLFIYVFVNVGMVTGILPVVGVPLPFMSYGGTALFTMGIAFGIMMSISRHRSVKSQCAVPQIGRTKFTLAAMASLQILANP